MGGGMQKILLASVAAAALAQQATAADMPVKAVRAPLVAAWSWTGFYAGVNGGYSWGRSATTATFTDIVTGTTLATGTADFNLNGPLGGFQIGYNIQSGNMVWGLEADLQVTNQRGSADFICAAVTCAATGVPVTATLNQKLDWFGTVRGRLGMTFSPWMAYITGGLAYGRISSDGSISGANTNGVLVSTAFSNTQNNAGWVFGGGVEGQISGNWTLKAEYLYMDLGTVSTGTVATTISPPIRADFLGGGFSSRVTDNIFRIGLNHKFGG
jgi:outer membrane immunogenic protein